jgi:hypothetical protein
MDRAPEERFSTTNSTEAAAVWSEGFSHSHTTTENDGRVVRFHFADSPGIWQCAERYRAGELRVDPKAFLQGYKQFVRVAKALTEIAG